MYPNSPLKQVGKTVNGQDVGEEQISLLINSIISALHLREDDCVLDLCCGNGLITSKVAKYCMAIVGVDFTDKLIHYAQQHFVTNNTQYYVADINSLQVEFFSGITKIYMYEAIQHFSLEDFERLLDTICKSSHVTTFFVGAVPDIDKFDQFYDTEEKRAFHHASEKSGHPHIGKWWSQSELCDMVERNGLTATILPQRQDMYCSHFRFDCKIQRL